VSVHFNIGWSSVPIGRLVKQPIIITNYINIITLSQLTYVNINTSAPHLGALNAWVGVVQACEICLSLDIPRTYGVPGEARTPASSSGG
jgi:hypothetical protein